MLRKKLIKAASVFAAVAILLTGCSDKNDEIDELRAELEALKSQQTVAETSASPTEAITEAATEAAVTEATTAATTEATTTTTTEATTTTTTEATTTTTTEATTAATTVATTQATTTTTTEATTTITTEATTTAATQAPLPDVDIGTYLNGEKQTYVDVFYGDSDIAGIEGISTTIYLSETQAISVLATIDTDHRVEGTELSFNDFDDNNDVGILITEYPNSTVYSMLNDRDKFSEAVVRIYAYEPKKYIAYYIKIKGEFDGKAYDIETAEIAEYAAPEQQEQSNQSGQSGQSGQQGEQEYQYTQIKCYSCGGNGRCGVCHGYGFILTGSSSNPTCPRCYGNGRCTLCDGKGYIYRYN